MAQTFTKKYHDLSKDAGFRFEFFCDCCGKGVRSTFRRFSLHGQTERAERLGRTASELSMFFGGFGGSVERASQRKDELMGDNNRMDTSDWRKDQEKAYNMAIAEVKPRFRRCPDCGRWVCAHCWDEAAGLCKECKATK
jgi:hypothetical protein